MVENVICLFRHGETEWNTEGRRQGQRDSPLTDKGRRQAASNAELLRSRHALEEDITVYSSPTGRARKTAEIILQHLGLPIASISFEPALMEASFGSGKVLQILR